MKEEVTPQENLEILSRYIIDAYDSAPEKEKGSIQLQLHHKGKDVSCYLSADGTKMDFGFGGLNSYDVKLATDLYTWLDLANGRLNPVWGVITGKLKFKGDTKTFD